MMKQDDAVTKNISKISKSKRKKEIEYISLKHKITDFCKENGYHNVIRSMLENFDQIDDLTNTQSVELFSLIRSLESALRSYERLQEYVL